MNSAYQTKHNDNGKVFHSKNPPFYQTPSEMIRWQRVKISPAHTQRLWPPVSNWHQWQTDGSGTWVCHQCLWALDRSLMGQVHISSLLLIINQNQPGPEKLSSTPPEQPAHWLCPESMRVKLFPILQDTWFLLNSYPVQPKRGRSQTRGAVFPSPFLKNCRVVCLGKEHNQMRKQEEKENFLLFSIKKSNRTRKAEGMPVPHAVGRGITVAEKVLHIKYVGGFA